MIAPIIYWNFKGKLLQDQKEDTSENKFKRRVSFLGIYNLYDKVDQIIEAYEKDLQNRDEMIYNLK